MRLEKRITMNWIKNWKEQLDEERVSLGAIQMASNRMTSDGMVSIAFNEIIATMQNEPLRMNVSEWTP